MDGIVFGAILREPFNLNSETHQTLLVMKAGHILLHAQFGRPAAPKRKSKSSKVTDSMEKEIDRFYDEASKILVGKMSIFVPAQIKEKYHGLTLGSTTFIEVRSDESHEMEVTKSLVSKILENRPENKVGVVAPLKLMLESADVFTLIHSSGCFPCPIVGDGDRTLSEELKEATEQLYGATVFIKALTPDDKQQLPEILGQFSENFAEIIFWTPKVASGIDFEEVQMRKQSKKTPKLETLSGETYIPNREVSLRTAPSRGGDVVGKVAPGQPCRVILQRPGSMGIHYGLLDTDLWVILSENGTNYFEKETYHEQEF